MRATEMRIVQKQRKERGGNEGDAVKVQMVEISGNKAKAGKREREIKAKRKRTLIPRGRKEGFLFPFFSSKMGRETRKVSSTWWLLGPVVVTVPSDDGGVSDDDGGSA